LKRVVIRSIVAAATVTVLLAVTAGFLVRWTVTDPKLRSRIVHYVAASSGLSTEAAGPIRLRFLPRPAVELHSVTMRGANGAVSLDADSLVGNLSFPAMLMGRLRVAKTILNQPTMVFDLDRLMPLLEVLVQPPQDDLATEPAAAPLAFLHTGGVTFRSGVLRVRSHDPRRDTLVTDIWATLEWPADGSGASLNGAARLHGVRGTLAATLDSPGTLLRGGDSGAYIRLKSPTLDLVGDGTFSARGANRAVGRLTASTPNLPVFLRSVGTPSPELDRIREAKLSAEATVADGTLALSNMRLSLDAMLFEGAMAFADHAGHPSLAGTLATEAIDVGPFLAALPSPLSPDQAWSTVPFDTRSVAYEDIDLRISASRARLGRLEFEDGGLSLQSGGGRMELSLGEARAYDGLFKGRLVAKLDGDVTEVRADATVSQFDLKALAQDFGMGRQLTGTTTGHLTLEGRGRNMAELVGSLSGRGQVGVHNGDIGPELVAMLVHPTEDLAGASSQAIPLDQAEFDSASLGFEVSQGLATVVDGWILRPDFRALVAGSCLLAAQQAELTAQVTSGDDPSVPPAPASRITVAGSWRDLKLTRRPTTLALPSGPRPALATP
jgi:AsmA protein